MTNVPGLAILRGNGHVAAWVGPTGSQARDEPRFGVVTGGRTFVAGNRVFTFFASTADPALLDAEVTTKYLDSIRLGAAP